MFGQEQSATEPPPELVKQLAEEMVKCRQRGLEGIDKDTRNQRPVKAPQLERLALQYCHAQGLEFHGRIASIIRLLRDGLDAYMQRGCDSDGMLITELFFGDTATGAPAKSAGQLLDDALARRGHSEQWFKTRRQPLFKGFAAFLLSFTADTAARASTNAPQATRDIAPNTASTAAPDITPAPACAHTGRKRPIAARITVMVTLAVVLLVGAGAVVVWFTAHKGDGKSALAPQRASSHRFVGLPAGAMFTETVASGIGAATFTDPYSMDETGLKIPFLQPVQVPCKVYSPIAPSIGPLGYWYRIASPPWNNHYYAPANSFLNGDPPHGPYTGKDIDPAVPDCPTN